MVREMREQISQASQKGQRLIPTAPYELMLRIGARIRAGSPQEGC
jgi:hypothetical protein